MTRKMGAGQSDALPLNAALAHSMRLLAAIDASEKRAREFDLVANGLEFDANNRFRLSAALLDQAHEHHKAVCLLLKNRLVGSGFSLVRVMFETTIRGVWLYRCATDEQVEYFSNDPKDLRIDPMIEAIEASYGTAGGILTKVKTDWWSDLCSYAHGGSRQADRRVTSEHIVPAYSEKEQLKVVSFSDFCFYFAAIEILNLANRPDLAAQWSERYLAGDTTI